MWKPQGIYSDFLLSQPTILFGNNSIWGLADYPVAKVAVIHGKSMGETTRELIQTVFKKKAVSFHLRSWSGEPEISELEGTIHELECVQPDTVIAVGGGSVIDGVKLCRLYYEFPYYQSGVTKVNQLSFTTNLIAIPTTVGSGAEASSAAVYWNREASRKEMIINHDLRPSLVILDSCNVENIPYKSMVASVLDAIAHVTEGYVSNRSNELAEKNAEMALAVIYHEMSKQAGEKVDFLALQYAGYLGGIVQNHCIVGIAHAVAHQLCGYGYSHGEAVALLLPAVIKLNRTNPEIELKYERLCQNVGIADIDRFLLFLEEIIDNSGIGKRKSELNALLEKLIQDEEFIDNVMEDRGGKGNPIPISKELIIKLVGEYL